MTGALLALVVYFILNGMHPPEQVYPCIACTSAVRFDRGRNTFLHLDTGLAEHADEPEETIDPFGEGPLMTHFATPSNYR